MAIRYHFDLYPRDDPRDGTRLVRFTKLQAATYKDVLGVGSGVFSIRASETEAEFIDPAGEQYVRVVEEDTVGATETVVGGFFISEVRFSAADSTGSRRLVCGGPSVLAYVSRAVMATHTYLPGGYDPYDDVWRLYAQGPPANTLGSAFWRVMYEATHFRVGTTPYTHRHADFTFATDIHADDRTANAIPDLDVTSFDNLLDSHGNAWTIPEGEIQVQVGENILGIVKTFLDAGLFIRMDPDTWELHACEGHRVDRSGASWAENVIRFQTPTDATIVTGNLKSDAERLIKSHIRRSTLWVGGDDTFVKRTGPTDILWEGFERYAGVEDGPMESFADLQITAREEAYDSLTIRFKLGDSEPDGYYRPWIDVDIDDLVVVHSGTDDWDFNEQDFPVAALRIELRQGGDWDAFADLGGSYGAMQDRRFEVDVSPAHSHPPNPELCRPGFASSETIRLYPSDVSSDLTTDPADDASWEQDSSTGGIWSLATSPLGDFATTDAVTSSVGGIAGGQDCLLWRGAIEMDAAMAAVLAAGGAVLRGQIRSRARSGIGINEASQDLISQIGVRVTQGDSTTIRGTALALHSLGSSSGSVKWRANTTYRNATYPPAAGDGTLSAVSGAVAGDYLMIEVGYRNFTTVTSGGSIALYNGAASDLPEDDASTDLLNPWFELVSEGISEGGDLPEDTVLQGLEVVGTSIRASRCDHQHAHGLLAIDGVHYHDHGQITQRQTSSSSDPSVNDDSGDGYDIGWLWFNETSGDVFILTDDTLGAAVWESITGGGGGGSLTVEEEDGTPSESPVTKIEVPNGSLTVDSAGVVSLDYALSSHSHGGGALTVPDLLNSVKGAADTPDDEFAGASGSALDGKWTVVDGSNTAVSLLNASGAGLYRIGQRAGWLMLQIGTAIGDSVELRQDYTLPDGNCLVMPAFMAFDRAVTPANNEVWFGMGVNVNDTGPFSGTAAATAMVMFDTEASATLPTRIIGYDGSNEIGNTSGAAADAGPAFLRIDRVGLAYHIFYSFGGFSWTYLGTKTFASAADNVWLFARCVATMGNRIVVGTPWIRQGTALAIDPWPL